MRLKYENMFYGENIECDGLCWENDKNKKEETQEAKIRKIE
jgi:hypothetical protein